MRYLCSSQYRIFVVEEITCFDWHFDVIFVGLVPGFKHAQVSMFILWRNDDDNKTTTKLLIIE